MLSNTELYLLNPELEINPILQNTSGAFQLIFNIATGQCICSWYCQRLADVRIDQDKRLGSTQNREIETFRSL